MAAELSCNVRLDIEAALDRLEYGSIIIKIARHKIIHVDFVESRQYDQARSEEKRIEKGATNAQGS